MSFCEKVSAFKKVIKKEQGGKKKGQTSQKISRFDPFYFFFYFICHKWLMSLSTTLPCSKGTCASGHRPIGCGSLGRRSKSEVIDIPSRCHSESCRTVGIGKTS